MASQFSSKINVVVRLHPNEDGLLYQNCPHVRVTKDAPSLNVTLDGCDWLGSLCSTVLYDALLFNKPVWQFHADGWADLAENWKQGLARRIASADNFEPKRKRFYRRMAWGAQILSWPVAFRQSPPCWTRNCLFRPGTTSIPVIRTL